MKIRTGFGRNLPLAAVITAVYNEFNLLLHSASHQHYCLNSKWLCHVIAPYATLRERTVQNSITSQEEATFHRILANSQTGVLINHDLHVNRSLFHMSAMTWTTQGSEVTACLLLALWEATAIFYTPVMGLNFKRVFSPWEFIQTSHSTHAKNLSERKSSPESIAVIEWVHVKSLYHPLLIEKVHGAQSVH